MSDGSPTSDSVEEPRRSGRPGFGGRSRAPQIGQGVPDIELVDEDGAPATGRSTYSTRIAASKDAGVQLPDEQLERLESERDQALTALDALQAEFDELKSVAESRVDAEDLTRVTGERDLLADEVVQLREAAVELKSEVEAKVSPQDHQALIDERDALQKDHETLAKAEQAAQKEAEKVPQLTAERDTQTDALKTLQGEFDALRKVADERVEPATHQQALKEQESLAAQVARLQEVEKAAKEESKALASLSKEHDEQLAANQKAQEKIAQLTAARDERVDPKAHQSVVDERDRLSEDVKQLREVEKVAKQEQTKLVALTKKHEAKLAAHDKTQAELKEAQEAANRLVDPAELKAATDQRDALATEKDALTAEVARLSKVEAESKKTAERLAALTKEHEAERKVTAKLQADSAALQQLADERVDPKAHAAVVAERDALGKEHESVAAARAKLQTEFDELRRIVDERVPSETHNAVVQERDALSTERDALAGALKKTQDEAAAGADRGAAQLKKLEADRDRQLAAVQGLNEDLAQLRRIAESRVEAADHQAVVGERDALAEQHTALQQRAQQLSQAAETGARDAQALAKLTEDHNELVASHQKLTEQFSALQAHADTMVEAAAHQEATRQRDELANHNEALVGEVERLRSVEEAGRAETEKLVALTDEHGRQMAQFEQLKNDFRELRKATEEWVDVEKYTEIASDRDALERDRDHLLEEVKKLQAAAPPGPTGSSEVAGLRDELERQAGSFRKLQADFDKYRKDTALERAAAKRAGIALADFEEEGDAEKLLAAQAAATVAEVPSEEVEALQKERDEYLDGLKRLQAEFENFRKRTARDRKAEGMRSARQLMEEVLPVMDNLGLASQALTEADSDQSTGVEMVLGQLRGVFASRGCQPVQVNEGDPFDPELHEAVQAVPSPDHPEGSVVSVIQPGYRLDDGTLLRPVRVVVSGAPNGG